MSIGFRAATNAENASTAGVCAIPSATVAGDLIIVHFYTNVSSALTIPSGFTQLKTTLTPAAGQQSLICWKIATSGDGGTNVSISNTTSCKWSMTIEVYSGCDGTTPIDVTNSAFVAETAAGTTHSTPSVTVSPVGAWAVFLVADRASPGSTTFTISAGSVETQTAGNGGGGSCSQAAADSAGTVATGTLASRTWTGTASTANAVMATIILVPASTTTTLAVTTVLGQFSKKLLDFAIAGGGAAAAPTLRLMDSSFSLNIDTQVTWADVVAHEVAAGNGYPTNGTPLTSPATSYDTPTHRCKLTSPNVTFTGSGSGFSTAGCMLVLSTGTGSTSLLAAYLDFGGVQAVASGAQLILAPDPTLGWLFGGLLSAS